MRSTKVDSLAELIIASKHSIITCKSLTHHQAQCRAHLNLCWQFVTKELSENLTYHLNHVLVLAMNGVLLQSRVDERSQKLNALDYY